jgi:hypothetical protein
MFTKGFLEVEVEVGPTAAEPSWRWQQVSARSQRPLGRAPVQDSTQGQLGPQGHCGPQAQGVCEAAGAATRWQPQRQPCPEQAAQLQGVCWVSFMTIFLGLHR